MKRNAGFLTVLFLVGCAGAPKPGALDVATITSQCHLPGPETLASIVRIATADGSNGSGIVIGENLVLTAAHVVDDGSTALVTVEDERHEAAVLSLEDEIDLALLAVRTGALRPVPISDEILLEREPVWAIGFPLALAQATTSGVFGDVKSGRLWTTARIDSGTSGGALLHCVGGTHRLAGLVRGFVAFQRDHGIENTGISTSVPSGEIVGFLRGNQMMANVPVVQQL